MKLYCAVKLRKDLEEAVLKLVQSTNWSAPLVPVPLDRLHITTLFLGEVPWNVASDIMRAGAKSILIPSVAVERAGTFDGRVVYLSINSTWIHNVHRQQHKAMQSHGMNTHIHEDRYTPHLTLAKAGGGTRAAARTAAQAALEQLQWPTAHFQAYSLGLYHQSECLDEVDL